jgi:hypothetical protein
VQPPRRSPRKAKVSAMHHWRVWLDLKSQYRSLSLNSIPRGPQAPTEADRQAATDPRAKMLQSKITSVLQPKRTTQTKKVGGKKKRGRRQGKAMEGEHLGGDEEGEEQEQRGAKEGCRKRRQAEYYEDSSSDIRNRTLNNVIIVIIT